MLFSKERSPKQLCSSMTSIRNYYSYILSLLAFVLFASCGSETVRSSWSKSPPTIDGDLSEWQSVGSVTLGDRQITVSAQNDADNLYLACRVNDRQTQQSIERAGITMWIDPDNKNKKALEFHFPASRYLGSREDRGGFWNLLTTEQRERASKNINEMRGGVLVIDGVSVASRLFSHGTADSIAIVSSKNKEPYSIEARIPLHIEKMFPQQHPMTNALSVGIRLEKLSGQRNDRGSSQFTRGGQMGMGRRNPSGQRVSSSFDDMWVELVLAPHE
jgi:hypothetical protein